MMETGSQNVMSRKSRRAFLISLGLFGFVLASCLIYNQRSFYAYAGTYDRALTQTTAWENRLTDFLTIRGQINGVLESVSQVDVDPAHSSQPIEQAISNLQTAWAQNSAAIPMLSKVKVDAGIHQMALAAMRTADSLHRKDLDEARRQSQNVVQIAAGLSPVMAELELRLARGRQGSEIDRLSAFGSMNQGQLIGQSVFFAFAFVVAAFLALGLRSAMEWLRHQPRAAVVATSRGFSLVELLMVVAITLVLSTIAIANITAVVSSSRIHAGISSMSGLLQNCRMLAVKKNKTLTAHVAQNGRNLMGYVKDAADTSDLAPTDTQVKWEAPVIRMSVPTGDGAPDEVTTDALGYTPQSGDLSFNSRGLPCAYSGGVCTNSGFLYYFKDTTRNGNKGWAALSISPAGKIKKWFWSTNSWTD